MPAGWPGRRPRIPAGAPSAPRPLLAERLKPRLARQLVDPLDFALFHLDFLPPHGFYSIPHFPRCYNALAVIFKEHWRRLEKYVILCSYVSKKGGMDVE